VDPREDRGHPAGFGARAGAGHCRNATPRWVTPTRAAGIVVWRPS
jgi:hypothetical protein